MNYTRFSTAEERRERQRLYQAQENTRFYKDKWLDLRYQMREYFKETGTEIPEDIKKLIGWKDK